MIRIAVCDDFKDTVNQVNGYLSEYQQLRNRKLDIKSFFNAEDLWEYLRKNRCDLIILDIELVKMNGVELGHLIRTELKDNIIKIVYISAKNCYDRLLFDVQPLNFLQKPIDKEKLFKMIDLTIQLSNNNERFFTFENKQGAFRIKFSDILYFESFDHDIKIATASGNYEFKSTLSEVMKQLSNSRFLQVHRSYIINYNNTSHTEISITYADLSVNYCPAYLMQDLANLTTSKQLENYPTFGFDTRGKYADAKTSFIVSSGFGADFVVCGMVDPHMQPTYYLIAHNTPESQYDSE